MPSMMGPVYGMDRTGWVEKWIHSLQVPRLSRIPEEIGSPSKSEGNEVIGLTEDSVVLGQYPIEPRTIFIFVDDQRQLNAKNQHVLLSKITELKWLFHYAACAFVDNDDVCELAIDVNDGEWEDSIVGVREGEYIYQGVRDGNGGFVGMMNAIKQSFWSDGKDSWCRVEMRMVR